MPYQAFQPMTDETPPEETEPSTPELRSLATVADFDAVDIEAPIRGFETCDAHGFFPAYEHAFVVARDADDEPAQIVYRLFYNLCTIAFHTSDPANVWGPLYVQANGNRAAMPEDFLGEQTATLAAIVGRVENPGLKARLADIAWSNNRRDGASAVSAIEAYCGSAVGLLEGRLKPSLRRNANAEALPLVHRALQIARDTTKTSNRPQRLLDAVTLLYDTARSQKDITTFVDIADLSLGFKLRKAAIIAPELEMLAADAPVGSFPLAVKKAWDFAARLYITLNDKEARQRCLFGAVEQTLAMREQVKGSAAAEAGWVMEALQQLRHIDGREELEYNLEIDLRRLQKASLKQMGSFQINLEIGDTPLKIAEHFSTLTLSDSLRTFAKIEQSRDPEKLRAEARQTAQSSPLMAMMPFAHVDDEGRTDTQTPGAPHDAEPDEVWYRNMIDRSETIRRHRAVVAMIEPARLTIHARFGITERHFEVIVGLSAFIPETQKPIIALGFARLFQGDFMSATYLLIPQLEPCLRHLLKINGHDPSKRRDDSTEQDLSLNNLYIRFRPQIERLLTPPIALEIDRLFNAKPGPALRHELAHGQIGAGGCFHPNVYYGNWLIYRICCLFVLASWDEMVAPQLTDEG